MPLTKKVTFQSTLENCNKVQVPKLIRWQFKMENEQVLKVGVNALDLGQGWQFFYAKMIKGRSYPHSKVDDFSLAGRKAKPCRLPHGDNTGANITDLIKGRSLSLAPLLVRFGLW